jgi:hypothetical protein
MKNILKILLFLIVAFFIINKCNSTTYEKEVEEEFWSKNSELKEKKFQELNLDQKQTYLNQIILSEQMHKSVMRSLPSLF